jgi:hypothetical protein
VAIRNSGRPGVIGKARYPDGLWILDQYAEQTVALRQFAMLASSLGFHADVQKPLKKTVATDDPKCRVTGPRQIKGRVDNGSQHRRE